MAWNSQVAVCVGRSRPALTRRMKPLLWRKSKSPWNEPRPSGMWMVMSPSWRSPRRKRARVEVGVELGDDADLGDVRASVGRVLELDRVRQRLAGGEELLRAVAKRALQSRLPGLPLRRQELLELERRRLLEGGLIGEVRAELVGEADVDRERLVVRRGRGVQVELGERRHRPRVRVGGGGIDVPRLVAVPRVNLGEEAEQVAARDHIGAAGPARMPAARTAMRLVRVGSTRAAGGVSIGRRMPACWSAVRYRSAQASGVRRQHAQGRAGRGVGQEALPEQERIGPLLGDELGRRHRRGRGEDVEMKPTARGSGSSSEPAWARPGYVWAMKFSPANPPLIRSIA